MASQFHTVRTDTPADSAAIRTCTDDNCPASSTASSRRITTRRVNARSPERDTSGPRSATETDSSLSEPSGEDMDTGTHSPTTATHTGMSNPVSATYHA
ncbi:hypothetical protein [Kitasatospora sp. MY 5-36]|uniref:hypothetical protein n=1 Tax=Kitasatospora sp. MY 5-36 TaxID=1678027 RepID=UPI000AD20594|nr:hypothetical protein [Kitasatospora sp. MY 5-36]